MCHIDVSPVLKVNSFSFFTKGRNFNVSSFSVSAVSERTFKLTAVEIPVPELTYFSPAFPPRDFSFLKLNLYAFSFVLIRKNVFYLSNFPFEMYTKAFPII